MGDVDGDGDLDAFVANYGQAGMRVWFNDGSGTFTDSGQISLLGDRNRNISLGDVDGDGDLDAFLATSSFQGGNRVWINDREPTDYVSITKTSSRVAVVQGGQVTYTIVVTNLGSGDVTGATVTDIFPDTLVDVAWTADMTGSGVATLAGSGQLNELIDLTNGSFITYTITGTVAAAGTANQAVDAIITNLATVTLPTGVIDTNPTNNTAHDSDMVLFQEVISGTGDFGDSGQSLGNHDSLDVTFGDVDGDGDLDAFVANKWSRQPCVAQQWQRRLYG